MTPEKLKEMLGFGEHQNLEMKDGTKSVESIGATVCAFLNSSGGVVVCGVQEASVTIQGLENASKSAALLEKKLRAGLTPAALVSVEVFPIDGKDLVLVDVPEGTDKPFAFNNDIFIRQKAQTRKATVQEIREMVLTKSNEPERWERRISGNLTEADLDSEELMTCVVNIQEKHPSKFDGCKDEESVLNSLSLARYGQLTNAGDLFFSKKPYLRLPQTRVRATCFTTETSDQFRDNRIIEGPLIQVFEEALRFILRNIPRKSSFKTGEASREDRYLYPIPAIREGLINAFAHRDYADYSGGLTINVYPSRLEIRNSGAFPQGITTDNISKGHFIVLRNPDIANVLNLLGLMERVGRGARMIVEECEKHGLPAPAWESSSVRGVTLTLKSAGELDIEITEHQVSVMRKCMEPCGITSLMEVTGRSDRTKFRHQVLQPLLDAGLVAMTIPDKPKSSKQQYKLTPLGENVLSDHEHQV